MKIAKMLTLLAGLSLIGAAEAHYDPYYRDYHDHAGYRVHGAGKVNKEQSQQRRRIQSGLARGQLTPYEYDQLARQQQHIEHVERRFKQDGRLDWRERQILKEELARSSDDIRYFKHNDHDDRDGYFYR
ncbi:hypothetical protein [Methylomicrobium lacus]|uniref:hypothetical protein n=1 Tax=Methylomicrobium lacus TaxID=136992 RepID=UPI0035A8BE4F